MNSNVFHDLFKTLGSTRTCVARELRQKNLWRGVVRNLTPPPTDARPIA